MKSIIKASAILGSSSLITVFIRILSAKAWAIFVGPEGVGLYGVLWGFLGLLGILSGFGVATGLVRMGAQALAEQDEEEVSSVRKAAELIMLTAFAAACVVLLVLHGPISRSVFGKPGMDLMLVPVAIALFFTLHNGVQSSTINAYHRVGALAKIAVYNSIASTVLIIGALWLFGAKAIPWAIVVDSCAGWSITRIFLAREVPKPAAGLTKERLRATVERLLRFGGPYVMALLVGSGVQNFLPILVNGKLGIAEAGFYRAATTIAATYLGIILVSMSQDYYPRIAALKGKPEELRACVHEQQRLVLLITVPVILVSLAVVPFIIPILYSQKFVPATKILEWQLLGDMFRFGSWTMSYAIVACLSSAKYLLIESVLGVVTLAASYAGMALYGVEGLGMAFLVSYIVYSVVVYLVAHRSLGLTLDPRSLWYLGAAIAAGALVRSLPALGLEGWRSAVSLALGLVFGGYTVRVFWRELGGWNRIRTRFGRLGPDTEQEEIP